MPPYHFFSSLPGCSSALPRFDERLFVVIRCSVPEREICFRFGAMAAVRTKDRKRNTAKTKRGSRPQRNKEAIEPECSKITWSFHRSKINPTYKELGVAELQWPAEDERELSQEIVRVNPLNRHSIVQVNKHFLNEYLTRT